VLLNYGLMSVVSITVVGAFDAVGSILVVALMIAPPATAFLLIDRLGGMVFLSGLIGFIGAVGGYWFAHAIDASIAGSMATMAGVLFGLVFLFAPNSGIISIIRRRAKRKWEFAQTMLAVHLFHHENRPEAAFESSVSHLHEHMKWDTSFAGKVVRLAVRRGLMEQHDLTLKLSEHGRETARKAMLM
jgi:manganese/zinc/iron transport system permease protein